MLTHTFFLQLSVIGSTMGTRDELGPDAEVRSFAIVDGVITEEPVHILED